MVLYLSLSIGNPVHCLPVHVMVMLASSKPFRDILKNLEAMLPPLSRMPVEKHSHYHRLVPCFRSLILFFNTVVGEKTPLFQAICLPPFFYGKRQWLSKYKMLKRDLQIKDEQKSEAYISKLGTVALSCSSRIRSLRPARAT